MAGARPYTWVSVKPDSISFATCFRSLLMPASTPFWRWFRNTGIAIAARMPMMMMTTRSSMSVKPRLVLLSLADTSEHGDVLLAR